MTNETLYCGICHDREPLKVIKYREKTIVLKCYKCGEEFEVGR